MTNAKKQNTAQQFFNMFVHYQLAQLPTFKNAVITIGSFDGVHAGHQKIFQKMRTLAHENGGEQVVITFHPHPRSIIFPKDQTLSLLNTLEEKIERMRENGVDHLVIVPFNVEFSQQSAVEYVENFIIRYFHPSWVVIGYDHRFGMNRDGNIHLLEQYEKKGQFRLFEIPKFEIDDISISSTKIRKALTEGDVETAVSFLGAPYPIMGKVVTGDQIGTSIGFPTANIQLPDEKKLLPKDGVYAVSLKIHNKSFRGMMYIGNRPTLKNGQVRKNIEVHIFDFNEQIYDETLTIYIHGSIRDDQKFDNLSELRDQLERDELRAKELLDSKFTSDASRVTIAILNYNGEELLDAYLPSVANSSQNPFDTVVIDNASHDESLEFLQSYYPEIEIIELHKNHGFAEGYNIGLKSIETPYVVLLNSDVRVTKDWLDPILEKMDQDKSIGAMMPKVRSLEQPDHFEYAGASGGFLDLLGYPFCRGRIFDTLEKDEAQYDQSIEVAWVSGATMVIRTRLFKELGGFDGSFFAHQEEIDLCWRIRRAGFRCMAAPQSLVYHLGGGTLQYESPQKTYLNFRNNLNMLLKNEEGSGVVWKFFLRLVLDGIAGIRYLFRGQWNLTLAIIKAHFSIYKNLPNIIERRNLETKKIKSLRIGPSRNHVIYPRPLIWDYFIGGKKTFSQLKF